MPRANCQNCQRSFTFRAGTATARVVCPFCKTSMDVPSPTALPWFLARGNDQYGPYTWEQLVDMAARRVIGLDDMLVQQGQAQWSLASTFLNLHPAPVAEAPIAAYEIPETPDADISYIQTRLKELSQRYENARRGMQATDVPSAEVPAEVEETPPVKWSAPVTKIVSAPQAQRVAPTHEKREPRREVVVTPAIVERAVVKTPAASAAAPRWTFWHSTSWLSTTATLLFSLTTLIIFIKGRSEERGSAKFPVVERYAEEQEAPSPWDGHPKNAGQERERDTRSMAIWSEQFVRELNRCRRQAGLRDVVVEADLAAGCAAHAKYLARNVAPHEAVPAVVYHQHPSRPNFSAEGQKAAGVALVCYAEPTHALERWMGRLFSRVQLLDPDLQRIGVGFDQNATGAWVCVADPVHGRGGDAANAGPVLYPAPNQREAPCTGFDAIDDAKKSTVGFPISATFPRQTVVRNVRATMTDDADLPVDLRITSPELPLNAKLQGKTIGIHPLAPLLPDRTYTVVLIATVDGAEWRRSWQFTTAPRRGVVTE